MDDVSLSSACKGRNICKIFYLVPSKKPVTRGNWDKLSVYLWQFGFYFCLQSWLPKTAQDWIFILEMCLKTHLFSNLWLKWKIFMYVSDTFKKAFVATSRVWGHSKTTLIRRSGQRQVIHENSTVGMLALDSACLCGWLVVVAPESHSMSSPSRHGPTWQVCNAVGSGKGDRAAATMRRGAATGWRQCGGVQWLTKIKVKKSGS